jgi:hypothetical protein
VTRKPRIDAVKATDHEQESLQSILYRYFFFEWLFADMNRPEAQ